MTTATRNPTRLTVTQARVNRAQFHALSENGLLDYDRHHELIEGEVVEKMGQKEPHGSLIMRWVFALVGIFAPEVLRCQMPIVLNDSSEPEPDVVVTSQPENSYARSGETPTAADTRLVVEVSLTTLAYDLGHKALLYARAGIPDYWVSDVVGRRLIVHRDPTSEGYATITSLDENATVSPLAAPDATIRVVDHLP